MKVITKNGNIMESSFKEDAGRNALRQLGVTNKSVSKWERGICLPDAGLFEAICDILEISVEELLKGEAITNSKEEDCKRIIIDLTMLSQKLKKFQKLIICFFVGLSVVSVSSRLPNLFLIDISEQSDFIRGLFDGMSTGSVFVGSMLIFISIAGFIKYLYEANKTNI